jgi:hypothetical protein
MQVLQLSRCKIKGWSTASVEQQNKIQLVLYFGGRDALERGSSYRELAMMFPGAHLLGCSTGGQILENEVCDDQVAAVALGFDATRVVVAAEPVPDIGQSRSRGAALGRKLAADDLAGVFVLADGLTVDGTEMVAGLAAAIGPDVPLTGGMAGDGGQFGRTVVAADCAPRGNLIGAVGFYGEAIRIGHGCVGGWDVFGPLRRITRAEGNILFELDGEPALDLYERYLGEEEAKGLPATALRFPLQVHDPERPDCAIIRSVFGVDRTARSLTINGSLPQGWVAQLMRGNFDRLATGAAEATRRAVVGRAPGSGLALLVSCIGRRLLMGQRAVDEVEAAEAELDLRTVRLGFYAYGEIAPHDRSGQCELHNKTMVVTMISEAG